jgi:glutathione S-transferase
MLKIWGRPNSVNVQKAMWAIGELGLEHEHVLAGGEYGGNDEDWYLAMNPNGRVPCIQDGDLTLYESNAIVGYLAEKYGAGGLWPDTIEDRALANLWMDWQQTTLGPTLGPPFWQLIRTPAAERDDVAIEEGGAACALLYQQLDGCLAGKSYLVGERFTMADIPLGAVTYRWFGLDLPHPEVPNVSAWYERLSQRPAYQQHVMLPIT